jgi:predicted phosphodiesterase
MGASFFARMTGSRFSSDAVLDLRRGGKALVISDFHMGGGRRDDLTNNGAMLTAVLANYYLPGGWALVLNGDIEELARFSLPAIREHWPELYRIFDAFAEDGRLYKNVGNHDEGLVFEKNYPYQLHEAVRIETGIIPIYVYHGHQSSRMYTNYNFVVRAALRYFLKPLGIRNISAARSPHRRFFVEKQAYAFSLAHDCISIIGHTHRPLFESMGRFEDIKYEIENLCRDYPEEGAEDRKRIAREVLALRVDLGKLKRSEKRDVLRNSLYGEELPVPCLFNAGSAIGRKGINAIEIRSEGGEAPTIALVYWFMRGRGKKFVNRGWYHVDELGETPYYRSVLNHDRLDYVKARIELLGPEIEEKRT